MNASQYSTAIKEVQCVSLGTVVLTDKGEVFYAGDTRYGQIPIEEEKNADAVKGNEDAQVFTKILLPSLRVKSISCGGDHLFAIMTDDKVYGWGRNDSAQLGIGLQQDYMNTPAEVPAF